MKSTKKYTIYCHTHIESGRRYIGLTSRTVERRWSQHCAQAKNSKGGRWHFPNAIRKYGAQAFSHDILAVCTSLEEANMMEQDKIKEFDTTNPEFGFNLSHGGDHAPHQIRKNPWDDPEFRDKLTIINRKRWKDPEFRANHVAAMKILANSPEWKLEKSIRAKKQWKDPISRSRGMQAARVKWEKPEFRRKHEMLWLNENFLAKSGKYDLISALEISSKKFGKLRVKIPQSIKPGSNKKIEWICDCGREKFITIYKVMSGHTKSCGLCNVIAAVNMVLKKFGKLRIKTPQDILPGSHKKIEWVCDCGREKFIRIDYVLLGDSTSCGQCLHKP
jgi:hypothetical protein